MSNNFVVEADRRVVGIGVRVAGGYQFFSSDRAFQFLEGKIFPRARAMQHQVAQAAQRVRRHVGAAS